MARKLRIAIMAHEFPAISETFVLNHVTSLLAAGHEVTVLANRPRADSTVHPDVARWDVAGRTVYRAMPEGHARRLARGTVLAAGLARRRRPAAWRALDVGRFGREAASLALLYWAARLDGQAAFDVIHCHFGTVGRTAAFLRDIGALAGRLAVTFHGVDVSACLDADPALYDRLFEIGDLFLPISALWRDRLIRRGCPPERSVVHHMGIDLAQFPFRPRAAATEGRLRILCVGRLVEKKGFRYALDTVRQLRRVGFATELTVVGDGPLRGTLEQAAAQDALLRDVRFAGWRDAEAVRALYGEHDVLVAPSVTDANGDQEGIPVTLMEAMAVGLPVVSTWHSGIPELVQHGASGLLVPERDAASLAAALRTLVERPRFAAWMVGNARGKVAAEFDLAVQNARLVKLYEMLAGPRTRRRTRTDALTPRPGSHRTRIGALRA